MARPSILNDELIQQFVDEISQGLSVQHTCDLLMVTQPSYNNWMRQGQDAINREDYDNIYARFFLEIKRAHAIYVKNACQKINNSIPNWQSISWWLERTDQSFMPKQEIVAEEGKVNVIIGGRNKELKKQQNNE